MKLGIDCLLEQRTDLLIGKRIGILAHQASLNTKSEHTVERLRKDKRWHVTTLFGPEHGLTTWAQDMEAVGSTTDQKTKLPIYSLYGDSFASLSPTSAMLEKIDVLVVDLQDIGSRYYTYIWTTALAMKACAACDKKVIVCDRPNPLGGIELEGATIQPGFHSFVGLYALPVRHGMTIGEIEQLVNARERIGCDLTVIPMDGWRREQHWPDTKLPWMNPSPNMRSYTAEILYPGMCLIEGTNASEGRGTEAPFEIIGAPYVNGKELVDAFQELNLTGVLAKPIAFTPDRQKWQGVKCEGVRWSITDANAFRPYLTGLAFIWLLHKLYAREGFAWRTEVYEFVTDIPAIDLLTGSSEFRTRITTNDFAEITPLADPPKTFFDERRPFLLY